MEPYLVILTVLIAAIPGLLLTRMPTRPERNIADRQMRRMLLASPLVFQGFFVFVFGLLFPQSGVTGFVLGWLVSMGVCWWLPIRQRERDRVKKAAAQKARRVAKSQRDKNAA